MKLIKRLLWTILLVIKWIFIFTLHIAIIFGINAAVVAALAFLFSLTPEIVFTGIVVICMTIAAVWIAWEEAGEHV